MLLSFCLIFCQFQPSVVYKSIAYINNNVYDNNVPQHLCKEKFFCKNKDIALQKSDKGESVVLVDKTDHLNKMENLPNGVNKF